jgi:hypothetical protein
MLYAPRPKPKLVAFGVDGDTQAPDGAVRREIQDYPPDEHQDISARALANLAAEVSSVALANTLLPQAAQDPADPLHRHERIIGDIDQELADVRVETERLEAAAERLKAIYREHAAPLIEEIRAQKRREADLRREYERRIVRMQTKRPSRKRA